MNFYLLVIFFTLFNFFTSYGFGSNIYCNSSSYDIEIISSLVIVEIINENNDKKNEEKSPLNTDLEEINIQKKHIRESEKRRKKTITISFAGDCTIGYDENFSYENSLPYMFNKENNNYGYFFQKVKSVFENDDITMVNLETTLTTKAKKADKKFRFKGDPTYVNILKEGSIEMVNISNNHIYDYLKEGFFDTINTLKDAGILYSGEGYIEYFTAKDITIASIGYLGWSTNIKTPLAKRIKEAREKADIIVVSFHWGNERTYFPNQTQISLGRFAIDEGADVVVGHHPHVIQGIERYKDRYIVYSLGNFCFGGNKNPSDKDTFIFRNEFTLLDKKLVKNIGHIIPCSISSVKYINNYQPIILEDYEKQRVMKRIYEYSSKLKYGVQSENVYN